MQLICVLGVDGKLTAEWHLCDVKYKECAHLKVGRCIIDSRYKGNTWPLTLLPSKLGHKDRRRRR